MIRLFFIFTRCLRRGDHPWELSGTKEILPSEGSLVLSPLRAGTRNASTTLDSTGMLNISNINILPLVTAGRRVRSIGSPSPRELPKGTQKGGEKWEIK